MMTEAGFSFLWKSPQGSFTPLTEDERSADRGDGDLRETVRRLLQAFSVLEQVFPEQPLGTLSTHNL